MVAGYITARASSGVASSPISPASISVAIDSNRARGMASSSHWGIVSCQPLLWVIIGPAKYLW